MNYVLASTMRAAVITVLAQYGLGPVDAVSILALLHMNDKITHYILVYFSWTIMFLPCEQPWY